MRSIVASGKMLLSNGRKSQSDERHDELEQQARVGRRGATTLLKASQAEKQKILDEFTGVTGYHRKHAIRVLRNRVSKNHKRKRTGYPTIYR